MNQEKRRCGIGLDWFQKSLSDVENCNYSKNNFKFHHRSDLMLSHSYLQRPEEPPAYRETKISPLNPSTEIGPSLSEQMHCLSISQVKNTSGKPFLTLQFLDRN